MIFLLIQLLYFLIGMTGFVVFMIREDPVMMSASMFLLFGALFLEHIHTKERLRDLENQQEIYHKTYTKLVKKIGKNR